jgi:hypothetical protein
MTPSGPNGTWFATTPEFWGRIEMPIIGWQLWYADGSWFCSGSTRWMDAPEHGVQVLMVHHPNGYRTIVVGRDEYTLPGEFWSKFGLMIDEYEFNEIVALAMADRWRP